MSCIMKSNRQLHHTTTFTCSIQLQFKTYQASCLLLEGSSTASLWWLKPSKFQSNFIHGGFIPTCSCANILFQLK